MRDTLLIRGAREHNLRGVDLDIPKNQLVVLTGVSGSGKSTLAFDILHKEGQRQYMESLGLVTDQLSRPRVDAIEGLSPSISVDQHLTNRSPRSTVGTSTEVYTYLRVLFARLGHRTCSACRGEVPPASDLAGAVPWDPAEDDAGEEAGASFPCPHCGAPIPELGMSHFSFNKPAGACPRCTGLGTVTDANLERLIDPSKSVVEGGVRFWERYHREKNSELLPRAARHYGFAFDPALPIGQLDEVQRDLLLYGVEGPRFIRHFPQVAPPETWREGRYEGVVTTLLRRWADPVAESTREGLDDYVIQRTCPDCEGARLRKESREVRVAGRTLVELSRLPLTDLRGWLEELTGAVSGSLREIAEPVFADLRERLRRLVDVGVGYLSLERASPTLSAGEAQRLRLASLLGSGLTGVLYVLDEPTTGLHARDTALLIRVLRQLRDLGNTVLVIEHDTELMRAADFLVDVGPGAGRDGGQIVAVGAPAKVVASGTVTAGFLRGTEAVRRAGPLRRGNGHKLRIRGAKAHNLQDVTVEVPLGTLVAVTGVSGSGKSSLVFDVLDLEARRRFYGAGEQPGEHDGIDGLEHFQRFVTIDQAPIGRTPRSNAATYTDAFGPIREAFAATAEARRASLSPKHFSFNVAGGRCERCQGAGTLSVEMHFLPDVEVRCPACKGKRFRPEVLAVPFRGKSIADVLAMTLEDAFALFRGVSEVESRLGVLRDVGLGYLPLGQPATTLSGGEAQRVKLAKELGRRGSGRTLYLLDEPTTGLHPADVRRLLGVLERLVDAGNTVVVVEHNLDLIACADWVVDLGPEGGVAGGRVVAEGTPERVAAIQASHTGRALARLATAPAVA